MTGAHPREDARIFLVSMDPLQRNVGYAHVDAELVCAVDPEIALVQLLESTQHAAKSTPELSARVQERAAHAEDLRGTWIAQLSKAEAQLGSNGTSPTPEYALAALRCAVCAQTASRGGDVLWLNEATSNAANVWNHVRPEAPGSMIMSGGANLGWVLPAGIGGRLGALAAGRDYDLVAAVTGDGSFLFGVPSTSFWMARRYKTPFLTIILNNGGWASPKCSMLCMHPEGHGSRASMNELTVGFGPDMPDYIGVAAAAGGAWGRRVFKALELQATIEEAIRVVIDEKRSAVVECIIDEI